MKLSLACGQNKPKGFKGVDIAETKDTDFVGDLLNFDKTPQEISGKEPSVWANFKDNSIDEIECSHFIEHIPHENNAFFKFFDEVYRVLKPGKFDPNNPNIPTRGFARFIAPYWSSIRAWQDPTHTRAISEATFLYLNKEWRKNNGLDHYPIDCDFDFFYSLMLRPDLQARNQEYQQNAALSQVNSVTDIMVTIVKRK